MPQVQLYMVYAVPTVLFLSQPDKERLVNQQYRLISARVYPVSHRFLKWLTQELISKQQTNRTQQEVRRVNIHRDTSIVRCPALIRNCFPMLTGLMPCSNNVDH